MHYVYINNSIHSSTATTAVPNSFSTCFNENICYYTLIGNLLRVRGLMRRELCREQFHYTQCKVKHILTIHIWILCVSVSINIGPEMSHFLFGYHFVFFVKKFVSQEGIDICCLLYTSRCV